LSLTLARPEPDLVAVEARRHLDRPPQAVIPPVSLPAAARGGRERPMPTLAGYDELLTPGATA
jgi:hypothetical protein